MYIFNPSIDIKVIGEYGQVKYDYHSNSKSGLLINDFVYKSGFSNMKFFPLCLTPKAKITDFMTSVLAINPIQLIVSEAVAKIFNQYHGQDYEIGDLQIRDNSNDIHDFYLLGRTKKLPVDIIDFKNSDIVTYDWRSKEYSIADCNSFIDYENLEDAEFKTLSFYEERIQHLHHFVCPVINRLFLSKDISEHFLQKKCSGLEMFEYDRDSIIYRNGIRNLNRLK